MVKKCGHPQITAKDQREIKWLESGSPIHVAVEEIVINKKLRVCSNAPHSTRWQNNSYFFASYSRTPSHTLAVGNMSINFVLRTFVCSIGFHIVVYNQTKQLAKSIHLSTLYGSLDYRLCKSRAGSVFSLNFWFLLETCSISWQHAHSSSHYFTMLA